ncbi:MAG: cytochrome [Bacillales bacterium]|jgi:cytochrome c551|nr:cytochrome [Bacillales bacterium]
MKKTYFLLATFVSFILLLGACGENEGSIETEDTGQIIVVRNCANCHGIGLNGSDNNPAINWIGDKYNKKQILEVIKNGRGEMPASIIKGKDASKAAEYLSGLKLK